MHDRGGTRQERATPPSWRCSLISVCCSARRKRCTLVLEKKTMSISSGGNTFLPSCASPKHHKLFRVTRLVLAVFRDDDPRLNRSLCETKGEDRHRISSRPNRQNTLTCVFFPSVVGAHGNMHVELFFSLPYDNARPGQIRRPSGQGATPFVER